MYYVGHGEAGTATHEPRLINSSPPSAAYMRRWTGSVLIQAMPCRLFGVKPLPEPMLTVNWTLVNNFRWNSSRNTKLFIHENAFEIVVCEMAAILSRARWVTKMARKWISQLSRSKHNLSFNYKRRICPIRGEEQTWTFTIFSKYATVMTSQLPIQQQCNYRYSWLAPNGNYVIVHNKTSHA